MAADTISGPSLDTHWLPALDHLVPVPAAFREVSLDLPTAARELGCSPEVLTALVAAGLPAEHGSDGPRFDPHDVMNLGLLSGTGRSSAELGERRLMRLATGTAAEWVIERNWRIAFSASCSAAGCTDVARPVRPAPELLGGRLTQWRADLADPSAVQAVLSTRGRLDTVRTGAVREIYDDLLDALRTGHYRYGWVPRKMSADASVDVFGMMNCMVAAASMRDRAAAAGIAARIRRGVLLGFVGVEHAWTEVLEEDRWVALDPVLGLLAGRTPGSNPEFADFCRGSLSNRLLTWDGDGALTEHRCSAGGLASLSCRPTPIPSSDTEGA